MTVERALDGSDMTGLRSFNVREYEQESYGSTGDGIHVSATKGVYSIEKVVIKILHGSKLLISP